MAKPERPHRVEPDGSPSASTRPAQARRGRSLSGRRRAGPSQPARTRSIGVTLLALLLIPLIALVALWAFVASLTLSNRIRFQHYETLTNALSPGFAALTTNLLDERALSVAWLGSARRTPETSLLGVRHKTDAAVLLADQGYQSARSLLTPSSDAAMKVLFADLSQLAGVRAAVDSGADSVPAAYQAYDKIAADEVAAFRAATPTTDPTLNYMTQASVDALQLQGQIFGAMSLIGAALAGGGRMTQPERVLFSQLVGQQQLNVSAIFSLATSADRPLYAAAFGSAPVRQLEALENQVEASPQGRPIPVQPAGFAALSARVQASVSRPLTSLNLVVGAQAGRLRNSLTLQLAMAAGLGLVAILVAAAVAIRSGNRLRGELTGLYNGAREMASERLPRVIARLRDGDEVDVAAESPPLPTGRITEIARVADAFSSVQRTAVDAAVGQANLRKGVNQVFLNLSLRNQSLLHRQLGMLDGMERATNDPSVLADLFRLDHLTTRMRRHAEGLIILGGAVPGRGWREPVPVLDVLRAAIAEVEDYTRVDVASETPDAVVGAAVNDVIHLLAELVENATSFSPPNTRVEIRADAVGTGFAVEVEDRGLGLTPEELAEINARLASPPEFDLASSDQLGLFVVGQLAARHGIRVSLRESAFGGTTAIVILPHSIVARAGEPDPARPDAPSQAAAAPAAAPFPGAAADPAGHRERASAFSLTGRHRSDVAQAADPGADSPPSHGPWPPARRQLAERAGPAGAPPWETAEEPDWGTPVAGPAAAPWGGPGQPAEAGTHLGLPRRVRQASLAPQLRNQAAQDRATAWPATGSAGRSPEDTRSVISSLQDAWQRGRVDDMDYPGDEPGGWPGGRPGAVDSGDGGDR